MRPPLNVSLFLFAIAIPLLGFSLLPLIEGEPSDSWISTVHYFAGNAGQITAALGMVSMFNYLLPGADVVFVTVGATVYSALLWQVARGWARPYRWLAIGGPTVCIVWYAFFHFFILPT